MFKVRRDHSTLVIATDAGRLRIGRGGTKPSLPESVDIAIVRGDRCALLEDVKLLIAQLHAAKVFDVLLVGDEPITHPDFIPILTALHQAKIATRFTSAAVVPVCRLWDQINGLVTGFVFTATSAKEVLIAANYFSLHGIPLYKVRLDYQLGRSTRKEFIAYMLAAYARGFRVRLSARSDATVPFDWWDDEVNRLSGAKKCPDVSIDLQLAAALVSKMTRRRYSTRTQDYLMYVDLVDMTYGRSADSQLRPFTLDWQESYVEL